MKALHERKKGGRNPDTLTIKQRKFAVQTVKTGSPQQAAQIVYGYKNKATARIEAEKLQALPKVKKKIDELLRNVDYDAEESLTALIDIQRTKDVKVKGGDVINAAKMLLELSGYYIPKSQQTKLTYNFDAMDAHNLSTTQSQYNDMLRNRNK